ncbi:TetR/AcrR family transcriptional regulator [Pseudophaeobacter sp.]|uniref:TetR/AcrR family transcriptional regulator n=1 Tax=Pseudophaeobacter sp. TaxID=1971739 RepID=UPI0032975688
MAKADTKTRLMDAAEQLVRHRGADGFSYADLSTSIGIQKASIHYHFPAKSDLLQAIMEQYSRQVIEILEGFCDTLPSPAEQLRAFVDFYRLALQEGDCLCLCVALTIGKESLSEGTQKAVLNFRAAVQKWLENRFAQLLSPPSATWGSPSEEAAATLALVEGAQVSARIATDPRHFDHATRAFCNRLP